MPSVSSMHADPSPHIKLSEVIGALSYALDITEGQPRGHAARSCMLGMRLARELRSSTEQCSALFYGLLLKDLGCSSNASKMCYLFGSDDRVAKRDVKTVDWSRVSRSIGYIARHVAPDGSIFRKAQKFAQVALGGTTQAKALVALPASEGRRSRRRCSCRLKPPSLSAPWMNIGMDMDIPMASKANKSRCWHASWVWRRRRKSLSANMGLTPPWTWHANGRAPGLIQVWSKSFSTSGVTRPFGGN